MKKYLERTSRSEPLAVFRIGFGLLMCYSIIRFWRKGWIETLYLDPDFHFSYYGFDWVKPLGEYTYFLFIICFISSLFITIGFKYRISILMFFLSVRLYRLAKHLNWRASQLDLRHSCQKSCLNLFPVFALMQQTCWRLQ